MCSHGARSPLKAATAGPAGLAVALLVRTLAATAVRGSGYLLGLTLRGRGRGGEHRLTELEVAPGELRGPLQAGAQVAALDLEHPVPIDRFGDLVPVDGVGELGEGLQALSRLGD